MKHRSTPLLTSLAAVAALAALIPLVPAPHRQARAAEARRLLQQRLREPIRVDQLSRESIGERDEFDQWFVAQRAYPGRSIRRGVLARGWLSALFWNREGDHLDPSGWWRPLGPSHIPGGQVDDDGAPSPVSGRVTAIAVDPGNRDVVWVGAAQGGVWRTRDATSLQPSWTPLTDHEASLAIGSIAVDPRDQDIVYAGTGEPNRSCDSYYGQGVLRTTNAGRSWKLLGAGGDPLDNPGPFVGKAVAKLVVHPPSAGTRRGTTLWAATTIGAFSSGTVAACETPSGLPLGLWRSSDSGHDWELQAVPSQGEGPGNHSVQDLALDPVDPDTLYVAVRGLGIWKSRNAASGAPASFEPANAGFALGSDTHPLGRISLAIGGPDASRTLYAAVENRSGSQLFGLYRSTDGAATWNHVDGGANGQAQVASGSTLVRRVSGPPFVLGQSWTGRRLVVDDRYSVTINRVTTANTLLLTAPFPGPSAASARWSAGSYPTYCDGQCFYDMTVAVDPLDAGGRRVLVGGNPQLFFADLAGFSGNPHSHWRSDDAGASWRSISQGNGAGDALHVDDHALVFDGYGTLYDGNDGGVWRSDDLGASWVSLNTDLSITQFQGISTHPSDPGIVLGGTQDNGTNLLAPALESAPAWFHTDFGDGGQSVIDQSDPGRMYHTYFNQAFNFMGPARSLIGGSDGPGNWEFVGSFYFPPLPECANGMDPTEPVSFYAPLAQHPGRSPNPIYFGSNRVYRSVDPQPICGPPSWTAVSPVLTKPPQAGLPAGYLSWIAAHPALVGGREIVYTGSSDGRIAVSRTVDGSGIAAWSVIDAPPLPDRAVTGIYVSEQDPTGNTAWVTFSGFAGATPGAPGHVFETRNGLSAAPTWRDISDDLPDLPHNGVLADFVQIGFGRWKWTWEILYVATDIGVFRSLDGGRHWRHLRRGMPFVTVFGLEKNPHTGQIVAATHGRGVFELRGSTRHP